MKYLYFSLLLMTGFLTACADFEQEIEVDLPDYDPQYVVESYLEPGRPFRVLLTRSDAFFAPFPTEDNQFLENILVTEAEVFISYNGEKVELSPQLDFDFATGKLFNFSNTATVPTDFDGPYELEITLPDGVMLTSSTSILEPVPIDSVVIERAETDSLYRALTYLTDDTGEVNYYRRQLHVNNFDSLYQSFATPDDFLDNEVLAFGTAFDFEPGDTIYNTVYHIDRTYYDFLLSIDNAESSNGNPFGTPGVILGNIEGGVGIFTGLSYDRDTQYVEQ